MDIDYNELYGIETGEAVSSTDNATTEGQGAAQETQEQQEPGTDTAQEETPAEGQEQQKKQEQTREERARQAEGRRRREWEERGAKAERERNNATIASSGIVYPEGHEKAGQVISTMDELEAYLKAARTSRFKEGRATDGDIREVVREEMARASEPVKSAETQPPSEDPRIAAELAEIKRLDPEMTDLGAILRSEAGERFRGYVSKGLGFLDAYKLAAEDRLAGLRQTKAAEAARVQAASKDHLSGTKTTGSGALSVPRETEAVFREFFPGATDAEIQKMYNADQKRYGKK